MSGKTSINRLEGRPLSFHLCKRGRPELEKGEERSRDRGKQAVPLFVTMVQFCTVTNLTLKTSQSFKVRIQAEDNETNRKGEKCGKLQSLRINCINTRTCDANAHGSAAGIMEQGGQIKVWLNVCGVILPPYTNIRFLLAPSLLFAFVSFVCFFQGKIEHTIQQRKKQVQVFHLYFLKIQVSVGNAPSKLLFQPVSIWAEPMCPFKDVPHMLVRQLDQSVPRNTKTNTVQGREQGNEDWWNHQLLLLYLGAAGLP